MASPIGPTAPKAKSVRKPKQAVQADAFVPMESSNGVLMPPVEDQRELYDWFNMLSPDDHSAAVRTITKILDKGRVIGYKRVIGYFRRLIAQPGMKDHPGTLADL